MTINKALGYTLNVAGLDLNVQCFFYGCHLSHAKKNLFVLDPEGVTYNIVHAKIFNV